MLRLPKLQVRSFIKARSLQLNNTRLITTTKKFAPTATCITLNQQKLNYFSSLWRTTALVTAVGLAYNLTTSNVLALESNDCKLNMKKVSSK
jgi:hypothetical protein